MSNQGDLFPWFTNNQLTTGIGLIYIILVANFYGETLGCQFRTALANNMILKHFILFISIFFLISVVLRNPEEYSLLHVWIFTFAVYGFFLLSTKASLWFTVALLTVVFFHENFRMARLLPGTSGETSTTLDWLMKGLAIVAIVIIIVGAVFYWNYQKKQRPEGFSWKLWLLGHNDCENPDRFKSKYDQ